MRLPPQQLKRREPDLTGLINVVFLILIFFLVAATLRPFQARGVKLAVVPVAKAGGVTPGRLVLYADGRLAYQGHELSIAELAGRLRHDKALDRSVPFTVVADGRLKAHRALAVVAELKAAGIKEIAMLTERRAQR